MSETIHVLLLLFGGLIGFGITAISLVLVHRWQDWRYDRAWAKVGPLRSIEVLNLSAVRRMLEREGHV